MKLIKNNRNNNTVEIKPIINRLFYVSYCSEFLGVVAARTRPEAFKKALSSFGKHILKDTLNLEVSDSGKYENEEDL